MIKRVRQLRLQLQGSVAELADAADLKSAIFGYVGSSPTAPTTVALKESISSSRDFQAESV